jgi:hypothetical protein
MKRYILAGTALLAVVLTVILVYGRSNADESELHGFYGYVTYSNCDCGEGAYGDKVAIKNLATSETDYYPSVCRNNQGWYDTEAMEGKVYDPGNYEIWVDLNGESNCETSSTRFVTHGHLEQQVDLTASAPGGGS